MYQTRMKRLMSIAICALMITALTLGGALAGAKFQQDEGPVYWSERPMDDWPTEYGTV